MIRMQRRIFALAGLLSLASSLCFAADPLNILVVNDDGFNAPGIRSLRRALTAAGHRITVVGPRTDQSGKGTSFFADSTGKLNIRFDSTEQAWSVAGTPVDCVNAALAVILPNKPDLIVSGVNLGENLGTIANSSGTVSAAVQGINAGIPSIAVSAGLNLREAGLNPPFPSTFRAQDQASNLIVRLINVLQAKRTAGQPLLPPGIGLNINHPALENPGAPILTALSKGYNTLVLGLVKDADYATSGNLVLSFTPAAPPNSPDRLNDAEMFATGYITVTPIDGDWTASLPQLQDIRRILNGFIE